MRKKTEQLFQYLNFLSCHIQNNETVWKTPTLIPFSLNISLEFSLDYVFHIIFSSHQFQLLISLFSLTVREGLGMNINPSPRCLRCSLVTPIGWPGSDHWHVSGRSGGRSHGWNHGHLWWTQVSHIKTANGYSDYGFIALYGYSDYVLKALYGYSGYTMTIICPCFRPSTGIPVLHSGSHFRHGLLQLMIHTIDPLHDGSSNFGSYFLTRIEWLCFINHHYHLFTQLTDDSWINSSCLILFRKKRKIPPLNFIFIGLCF